MSESLNILDKNLCLVLNANWLAIGQTSIKRAIISMCSESNGQKAAMGMNIETSTDEDGNIHLVSAVPVDWGVWIDLPIRENDLYIKSTHRQIRAPTVIICGYTKVPMKRPKLGKAAILDRDGFVCQYSGEKLSRGQLNIDHVVPLDRGGGNSWENMVACRKDINFRKGNRLNHEVGLKLIRTPRAPVAQPVSSSIHEIKHPSWEHFLIK